MEQVITTEEAIERLTRATSVPNLFDPNFYKALELAVEALRLYHDNGAGEVKQQEEKEEEKERTKEKEEEKEESSLNNILNNMGRKGDREGGIGGRERGRPNKKPYGEFNNVLLTDEELKKLTDRLGGRAEALIEQLSSYMESRGKQYKSHYATILNWARMENGKAKISRELPKAYTPTPEYPDL